MFAIFAIFKLFRVVVGNTLRLKPASYAELGNNTKDEDKFKGYPDLKMKLT